MPFYHTFANHEIYNFAATSPLLLFVILLAVWRLMAWNTTFSSAVLRRLAVFVFLYIVVLGGAYVLVPTLVDDGEASIVALGWIAQRGLPLYPKLDSPQRYIMLYGPLTFLVRVPFYWMLGNSLFAAKLPGFLALLLTLLSVYRTCRHYASKEISILGLGAFSLCLIRFGPTSFLAKSDPLLLAIMALCTWSAVAGPPALATGFAGLACGIMPNLKASAVVYLIPILGILFILRGWRSFFLSAVGGSLLFTLPFALPNISLRNYIAVLTVVSHHALNPNTFARNIQYCILFFVLPLVTISTLRAIGSRLPRGSLLYSTLVGLGMVLACIPASKAGSGSYHLVPFLVSLVHLSFWLGRDLPRMPYYLALTRWGVPVFVTLCVYSVITSLFMWNALRLAPQGAKIVAELRAVESQYKDRTIEIGYGEHAEDRSTWYRFQTVLDGEPYTVDSVQMSDLQYGGIGIPPSTIRYIDDCKTGVWLIPRNEMPFTLVNGFLGPNHPIFDASFRRAFLEHYHRVSSGAFFDVWAALAGRCGTS